MHAIRHHVGVNAPIGEVYAAFASRAGLAGWWTRDVRGEEHPGGRLAFGFGGPEPAAVMEVAELDPPSLVRWRCVEGPDEWRGTSLSFELTNDGAETAVLFTHDGWRDAGVFLHHCSTKWAYFLLGLKSGFEGGAATPWPDDAPVSRWG
ncbi:MAG TPA: SRPBCC domain-containing protein [Acidimicrobiales bacterium]|jgi:uncharacterized protein YndB with AHSA1/START domain|nr:SRPBCC domain-containing protein [Acidimicrobiales bacterium]